MSKADERTVEAAARLLLTEAGFFDVDVDGERIWGEGPYDKLQQGPGYAHFHTATEIVRYAIFSATAELFGLSHFPRVTTGITAAFTRPSLFEALRAARTALPVGKGIARVESFMKDGERLFVAVVFEPGRLASGIQTPKGVE
jgi:hypothetical protein